MRIAVLSPFVDRQHGTERAVAELIERLAIQHRDEIQLYAQRVADVRSLQRSGDRTASGCGIYWNRVGRFPGPHLLQFLAWLFLNWRARVRTGRMAGGKADVVFSPGVNALDADVVLVHAVFHRLAELQSERDAARFTAVHRKLYYSLLCKLERRIYADRRVALAAVSMHTAEQLARYFGRQDVAIVPNGVDLEHFSSAAIASLRPEARHRWKYAPEDIVFLLVGNDWRNKGLRTLLQAMAQCKELPAQLLVVGHDEQGPFSREADKLGVGERVEFAAPVKDVRSFYAAADVLVAPSLEDSFNLPVLEAMACGLPVLVSPRAGVSEWLAHGLDCLLLKDPEDAGELAEAIRALAEQPELRETLAENAVVTAGQFTWDEHATKLRALLEAAAKKKARRDRTR